MKVGAFFGYKCPQCQSKLDIGAVAGSSELKCPHCGTKMDPDPTGKVSSAKVYCPKCKSRYGLINSDKCPQCGTPFESV